MTKSHVLVFGSVAAIWVGCSSGSLQDAAPFAEHRSSAQVTVATLHLGEDCASAGYAGCRSKVCGHFSPSPQAGYFCTRSCVRGSDCPRDWTCAQVFPSSDGMLCVPPSRWRAQVAMLPHGASE